MGRRNSTVSKVLTLHKACMSLIHDNSYGLQVIPEHNDSEQSLNITGIAKKNTKTKTNKKLALRAKAIQWHIITDPVKFCTAKN